MDYYGDKISENMVVTPEGYLVCKNVPIGRIGSMKYYGREIPAVFGEPSERLVKVYRKPEELFSEATIASFEGKPVTNTHPSTLLDINTTPMTERGHAQNVRREGDLLVADLHIKDAGLISEIQNNMKREVSSGYDCAWHQIGDGRYEQREIVGNHIAVVQAGRAGPRVAIHDEDPEGIKKAKELEESPKSKETGGTKKMAKFTGLKSILALGWKQFAQDADPEEIAKAMEAMDEEEKKPAEPAKEPPKEPAKDESPSEGKQLLEMMNKVLERIEKLEAREEAQQKETADAVMDAIEEDLKEPAKDEDPDEDDKKEPAKDEDPEKDKSEKKPAADAAIKQFVQDMKPLIMAIPDEKARLEAAKKFRGVFQDARANGLNGYANIQGAISKNKKSAMDQRAAQQQTMEEKTTAACNSWKAAGEKMRGGN